MKTKTAIVSTSIGIIAVVLLQLIWFVDNYTTTSDKIREQCDQELRHVIEQSDTFNMQRLAEQYADIIKRANINTTFVLNKIDVRSGRVLESTHPEFRQHTGVIRTTLLYTDDTHKEAVQAFILSPYKIIFSRNAVLLIVTAFIMLFIGWSITYQVQLIITQSQVAEIRKNFSNAMVHDMKSPLGTIKSGIHILRSSKMDNKPEKRAHYLAIMENECDHLLSLSNRILMLAKLEEKELALNCENIALEEFINNIMKRFELRTNKKITFQSFYHHTFSVYADATHLQEMLNNLIDNAIKYSHEAVHIEIICLTEKGVIKIKVRDNGFGISLKEQALIFEKFERASVAINRSLRGGATGFGIGLNYVQKAMQAHGGTVEVESIEGVFSEFTLSFPVPTENQANQALTTTNASSASRPPIDR